MKEKIQNFSLVKIQLFMESLLIIYPSIFQSRSLPRQPSASKNKDRGPPQRQINISISKDVEPLHKAEDAWKPSHKDDKKKDSDLDPQTEVSVTLKLMVN